MPEYRHGTAAIRALVRDDAVHRDVYINPELFDLEMERLWQSAWTYVGHDSQVPNAGDYYTTNIARQPLLMLRGSDGTVRVLLNRCAHKGSKIVGANSGNCGKLLRCSYHGWTYSLDGSLRSPQGYRRKFRRILRRLLEFDRQPGGPLAGRPSRSGGSAVAIHA
jgi:benzoate/toluate 1,2-dioxygenase subunit alpha